MVECEICGEEFTSEHAVSLHKPAAHDMPWQDEDKLREKYVEEGYSSRELAEEWGCSKMPILKALEKFGIEKTTPKSERAPTYHTLPNGYMQVKAQHNGKQYAFQVHRLVAVAEYGLEAVNGAIIHHRNGIPWDNRPSNLEVLESQKEHMERHY